VVSSTIRKVFLACPIESDRPYLWIDVTYMKVGHRREMLGIWDRHWSSEAETFWTALLSKLARRGLRGVKRVVSDASSGHEWGGLSRERPPIPRDRLIPTTAAFRPDQSCLCSVRLRSGSAVRCPRWRIILRAYSIPADRWIQSWSLRTKS
jgi:hypothetical protein